MHDHGPHVDPLQPVQADHGDGREQAADQGHHRGEIACLQVRLLNQPNARRAAGHRQPNSPRRQLAQHRPRQHGNPDRKRVRQRQQIGNVQPRQRIKRADETHAAGQAPHPQSSRPQPNQLHARAQCQKYAEHQHQCRPRDRDDLPVAVISQRVRQRAHERERQAAGEHRQVRRKRTAGHGYWQVSRSLRHRTKPGLQREIIANAVAGQRPRDVLLRQCAV